MSWYLRWRNVFRSDRLDDELENEFQYHLAETVDRLVADGMPEKMHCTRHGGGWVTTAYKRNGPEI